MELVETVRGETREVSRVRHALAAALSDWGVGDDDSDVAVLLTSEIVTNAIRYGGPPMELHAELHGVDLRVSMDDGGHDPVVPTENVRWDARGGRGLHLVEALSNRWGVLNGGRGKQVWFELKLAG
ncbi:ATP-binding protein [Angustibacter luteus]|uniref:ATP-binding protein n=1 Tax=Angustibacter luteus TaxID=658456 RepID=A0ABW1JFZ9_9ACTN